MEVLGVPVQQLLGLAMLAAAVPYMLRGRLAQWLARAAAGLTASEQAPPAVPRDVTPAEVLALTERARCPKARAHLVACLNCLLESDPPQERDDAADS